MIWRHIRSAYQSINRRKVDDAAATRLSKMRDGMLGAKEYTLDVDGLNEIPLGFRDLMGGLAGARYTGIVHHYVQPTELPDDIVKRGRHVDLFGNIATIILGCKAA